MKKIIYKSLVCAGALSLLMLPSCNYEEINTNPYEMTEEMGCRSSDYDNGKICFPSRNPGGQNGHDQPIPDGISAFR